MAEPAESTRNASWRWPLLVVLGGLGIAIAVSVVIYTSDDEPTSREAAVAMCEDLVRDRLKSPATAAFADTNVVGAAGNMWSVHGSVDSQNIFGAIVRSDYVCEISDDRNALRLIGLRLTER